MNPDLDDIIRAIRILPAEGAGMTVGQIAEAVGPGVSIQLVATAIGSFLEQEWKTKG